MHMYVDGKAKACPLCGSKHILLKDENEDNSGCYTVTIRCKDCGLTGYKSFLNRVNKDEGHQRTIDYWNTRKG